MSVVVRLNIHLLVFKYIGIGSPINCDNFYKRRQAAIQRKLLHLRGLTDRALAYEISDRLNMHWGKRLHGIHWGKVDPYFLMSVGWSVGGSRLSVVLEEMLRDPVCYCRGMPDLLFCQAMPPSRTHPSGEEQKQEQKQEQKALCRCGCETTEKCFVSEVKR